MIFQTLLSAAVVACMLFSEPIVCLASTQNVAKIKDILCVLILNGVEKDDLDENTIRKLNKLHVNINEWNNEYKKSCGKNVESGHTIINHDDILSALMTGLPQTSPTTGETVDTQPPNIIKLPKLEEMIHNLQATNIPDFETIKINENSSAQGTIKFSEHAYDNSNIENVLSFWNKFRPKKEKLTIITTTSAAEHNKDSFTHLVKNDHQIEKPKMLFEEEHASRTPKVVKTNNDDGNEKPQLTLTTGPPPTLKNHFNEYAEIFDVMYKKFIGENNERNHNHNGYGNIHVDGFGSGYQNLPSNNNPTLIEASTENNQIRLANMALPTYQTGLQTAMNMPVHILEVKPIRINYIQPETTKVTENNGTQLYSETVKQIANEVKTMLLAQLKKEIPLITLTPIRTGPTTETPKSTTKTTILPITLEHSRITQKPTRKEPQDGSSSSSETRKKLEETNGMVLKLFGLFEKLENAQQKTLSTFRPMLRPAAPAQGYLASPFRGYATTSTSAPTRDIYRSSASKNPAININTRLDPYQSPPMYNNMPYNRMPFNNMQYNNMQYSVLPPKPMSPYLQIPAPISYPMPQYNNKVPPKIYNNLNNPMENQYNYKMIKPSMVAINAKMIQTNEFIVMPLRIPINVKGRKQDVQRLIDNQNIILNNTLRSVKSTTTTTSPAPTTTLINYDRNYYEWNDKKNTNAADSRESEKFIESIEHERIIESREREKPRYGSREGRDDRSRENIKAITIKHRYLPKSHYKKTSQYLSERDREYERRAGLQSDENPTHARYHNDYKGPKHQSESMYGNRYRDKDRVDFHSHHKKTLDERDSVRDSHFLNRDLTREETKLFNRDPGRDEPKHFNREPSRVEPKHSNREPLRGEPKHYNRESPWDEAKHFNKEPLIDETKHYNREPLIDETKHFTREPSLDEPRFSERDEPKFFKEPRGEPKSISRDHTWQPKVFNLEPPRIKYEKQKLNDPRDPIEPNPISDSFEKLINGESLETKNDYEHRPMAPINKGPQSSSSKFSEKHFKNFLSTQQKVNSMLEKILSAKTQGARLK